jgi:tetratricopeptide (TPR) repeat protein
MCLLEKGERKKAEETLKAGLTGKDCAEEDRVSLYFELGELYEGGNQLSEALDCFKYVAERDRFHRNAGERVDVLRQRLGLENDDGDAGAKAGGRKNRVSYV